MSIICDSPKFEVSSDQASYFNIRMPGSFMATPVTDKNSPSYFDINPKSSPVQTPYFDIPKTHSPDGMVNNGAFIPKLPTRRQTLNQKSGAPKKPISMPANLSPFTPVSTSFKEFSIDSVAVLIKQQQHQKSSSVGSESLQHILLLLDIRSFSMFSVERIKSSLNICVPSTLLKRGSFSADKITETLVNDEDKNTFKDWSKYENIVLYDNDSDRPSDNGPISHLYKKFNLPNCKSKVGYLKGNYNSRN
ncbi:3771_t:CDS:2 [Diversispora eburnea]|uniref:3771_t:CDS:1 n=1 Tax=Diversispora eburnea TaxID=1213867 RepID=A0A9N8ZKW6_9GLOM|nr:3771_t:CDS:2 [Diversispora eburnea]